MGPGQAEEVGAEVEGLRKRKASPASLPVARLGSELRHALPFQTEGPAQMGCHYGYAGSASLSLED